MAEPRATSSVAGDERVERRSPAERGEDSAERKAVLPGPRSRPAAKSNKNQEGVTGGSKASVARHIEENAERLKVLAQRRDADAGMQDRALAIVRDFIIERKLIVFGGLSIDFALRLKGARLYPDEERPDYDCLSPNSVDDAYDLADILQRAGFWNVSAIRAIHIQTMKVRTDFVVVADIGFAPREIYDRLPVVVWNGMRALHPNYQRMDMHLSFCYPFDGAPREAVFHRWLKKDFKRYNMLAKHYPAPEGAGKVETARLTASLPGDPAKDFAFHGFAGYGLLRAALDELATATGAKVDVAAPRLEVAFDGDTVTFAAPPAWPELVVATPAVPALVAGTARVSTYDPYMDACPASAVVERKGSAPVRLYSTANRLHAIATVVASGRKVNIVTAQALLLYFLLGFHRAETDGDRQAMASFYRWTLEIVNAATRALAQLSLDATGATAAALVKKFVNTAPFFLTTRVIGGVNHDPSYLTRIAKAMRDVAARGVKDDPPPPLTPDVVHQLDNLPSDYFPAKRGVARPRFNPADSPHFRRAGEKRRG
ncbi:MAG: hypothetical protein KGL39_18860 [Patescibacteria group bacterium]|nr:hypothetical protein [Patescibacteria group bacterium]